MFLNTEIVEKIYTRISKNGKEHQYKRRQTVVVFACDNCDTIFRRKLGKMNRKRMNNNYFHCCSNCDVKRFAQRKGIERKKIWDMPASTDLPVGKY